MTTEKECNVCLVVKPLTDFHKTNARGGRFGRVPACKICRAAHNKAQRLLDPTRERARRMVSKNKRAYGLTAEQIDAMHDLQGGLCKICGCPGVSTGRGLHIDHCHTTGIVRGLLCQHCNFMLGHARDNISTLLKAVDYLSQQGG